MEMNGQTSRYFKRVLGVARLRPDKRSVVGDVWPRGWDRQPKHVEGLLGRGMHVAIVGPEHGARLLIHGQIERPLGVHYGHVVGVQKQHLLKG